MSYQHNQRGFVLLLTLMILSMMTIVVTQIFFQSRLYNIFVPLIIEKEKARQLALAGIPIAIAQLSLQDTAFTKQHEEGKPTTKTDAEKESDEKLTSEDNKKHAKALLKTLLTVQGRWQRFALTHEVDEIDAVLSICITCEDGKINLNNLYDFKKHAFVQAPFISVSEVFKTLGEISSKYTKNKNLFENIEICLKKRNDPLFEVTQVLDSQLLNEFRDYIFYVPEDSPFAKDDKEFESKVAKKPHIYLADLFTVMTSELEICPWVLSPSIKKILNFTCAEKDIDELIEKISLDTISWKKDWDTYLKPLYGVDFQSLPKELIPFLSTKFEPRLFSVLCYSKVGRVLQKLLVILERNATPTGESISVRKLYWL